MCSLYALAVNEWAILCSTICDVGGEDDKEYVSDYTNFLSPHMKMVLITEGNVFQIGECHLLPSF